MISVTCDQAWPTYHVWPISKCFMLRWSCGVWPACCHWLNTGMTDGRCPIMFMFTQKSYPCDTWFVCSTLRDFAVSNLGQLLFYLSITWSRCRNAFRDLWTMTIQWRHLIQCWLIISKFQWHLSEVDFTRATYLSHQLLENCLSKIPFKSPRGQWVNT